MLVLDESDGKLSAVVELAKEVRERPENEAPKGRVEMRSSGSHATVYEIGG